MYFLSIIHLKDLMSFLDGILGADEDMDLVADDSHPTPPLLGHNMCISETVDICLVFNFCFHTVWKGHIILYLSQFLYYKLKALSKF